VKLLGMIAAIKQWLGNGGPNQIGNVAANSGVLLAAIAALTPLLIFLHENRNEVFTTFSLTYGQCVVIGVFLAVYIKIVHISRPGHPTDRGEQ
jgi:hypothetical protein